MKTERSLSAGSTASARTDSKTERLSVHSKRSENSRKERSLSARDYHCVKWDAGKRSSVIAGAVIRVLILSYFFYRSLIAAVPLAVVGYLYYRQKEKELASKDVKILESQFGEAIRSVDAALKAGYSIENAFVQSGKDMERQFGKDSFIHEELEVIRRGLVINITLEDMLTDLATRSGSEAIEDFAKVFVIAKRYGGNMSEVISAAVETIALRIETTEEISTAISGKKMEQNIMKLMPFGILAYVGISSPGFFDPLYGNLTGIVLMTALLVVYLTAYFMGDKILSRLEEAG